MLSTRGSFLKSFTHSAESSEDSPIVGSMLKMMESSVDVRTPLKAVAVHS
jgi:hypothetical protein